MADANKSRKDFRKTKGEKQYELLQKVGDLSPDIFFIIDLQDKKIDFISKRVEELLGYDAEYLLNQNSDIFRMFIHPNDYENRIENLRKCSSLDGEEECEVQVRFRTVKNQWEWYRVKEKIYRQNSNGEVSHVLGIAQNIHEQRIGEEKLREEHRRLENAQKIGHIGSFERELPGNTMQCSREFYNILGIEPRPKGLSIDEFYSFVHPDDRESLTVAVEKTHATGEAHDTITRFIRPDKSIRYIHRRAALLKDDHGVPRRIYGTVQDITERIKEEKKRKRAEKLMSSTEIMAGMGSYEVELQTNSVYFSDGLYRIFGEEPGSFVPSVEWIDRRTHPDDVPLVQNIITDAISEKTSYTYTRRVYRKDGSLRILEAHGRFIANSSGAISKIIGLVQDITERKKAEEELLKSEKRSRNLLEVLQNAPDAYLVLTPDFYIEMASDAYLSAAETTREEIIGKYLFDVFPDSPEAPDATDVKNLKESFNRVLSTKKTHRMPIQHYAVRGSDGQFLEKHWSPTNTPVVNSSGEVEYIIHRVLEITDVVKEQDALKGLVSETEMLKTSLEEIKLQAQQLKENRALLQSVFDASPNSIILYKILYDAEGKPEDFEFLMINEFNHSTLGVPRNIEGDRFSEIFPTVQRTGILDRYKKTAETGEPADFETWYDGEGFQNWFHFRLVKLDNLLLATAEDITERKRTEETIQQMLNGSITAITILDSVRNEHGEIVDFTFKGANKAAETINGIPNLKLIGGNLLELFPGVKNFFADYVQVVETGKPLRVQRVYRDEHFNHWFDVSAVKNGDGFIMTFMDISDQKKAEKELIQLKEELTQKATDKYKKIINSMDEGFCIIEIIRDESGACVDYKYLETNPVFEAQTGLKNVIGKKVSELVPDLEEYWKEIYGDVAGTGKSIRFEDYAEPLSRWFDVNAFRVDSPKEQHVAIIFKDITERKEAEERKTFLLRLNDAMRPLENPAEIQETAMKILGSHLEVHRAYYSEILEDGDTLAGRQGYVKDIEPVTGKSRISDFNAKLHRQLSEGKTLVVEDLLKAYQHDSEARDKIDASQIRSMIAVPLIKNEQLLAVVTVQQKTPRQWNQEEIALVEEVCEQTWTAMEKAQSEKALRESEQRFRNLVEASALAVWETEPNGATLKESASWRNFTGQSLENWIGFGWMDAIHPEDRERTYNLWNYAVSTKSNFDSEYRLLSASGEERWTSVKATPILDIEGNITKWAGMNIDIHDRKQAEAALVEAKEEAEAATRAKEDFLSTMSHEIRTPLNAVIGLTNLLLDKNPREDQKENLNSLSFSAKNLLALINDILDFSKLEAGKEHLTVTDFDLPALLLNLKQAHQPLADAKQTSLELSVDERIPFRIAADQLKISQVLHNLVSNAVKFTSGGTITISVDLRKQEQDDLWLDFEIKDTGIGISKEKLEHIFEKFAQAESSTVRQYGGTGLGLSITRLLLELMGSEIHLDSTPGEGSRFYFSLPVKQAMIQTHSSTLPEEFEEIKDLRSHKLLLVEDVEINRKIIIQFMENWWQVRPDEARNGQEAVEMAKLTNYDLILMDIRMPVMDGYEATREIRKLPQYKNIPILALTADKNQEVQQADHKTKFSGLLTKPFEPLDLKKKILLHLPLSQNNDSTLDLQPEVFSYEDVMEQDQESRKELMQLVLLQLEEYKTTFINGSAAANFQQLADLQHKSKVVFDLLKLGSLARKMDESISQVSEGIQEEHRRETGKEVVELFNEAISRVHREIAEPVFEISRYKSIAGKNKDILNKLIQNSIRSLETYQEEFTAAAREKSPDSLANLIHKNTTSLHYLQANRLKNKINEFRNILENSGGNEEDLGRKQTEVQEEFELIINELSELKEKD